MSSDRKEQILDVGAKLAAKHGLSNVTRKMVAEAAKISDALVSAHLGSMEDARAAFKRRAKKLALTLPDKETEANLGVKLRARGKRSPAVIKKAVQGKKAARTAREVAPPKRKPAKPAETKPAAPAKRKPAKPAETKVAKKKKPAAAPIAPPLPLPPPPLN